ncbi:MAG: LCP family protein [Anaerolineae bacterium]|nr:LCP family protein [Anaerolineae bacterium]
MQTNLGCIRMVARSLLVIAAALLIFFLGRSAVEGIRALRERDAVRQAQIEQATTYPDVATQIALVNATELSNSAATSEPTTVSTDVLATPEATAESTPDEIPSSAPSITAEAVTATSMSLVVETATSTELPATETATTTASFTDVPTEAPTDTATVTVTVTASATLTFTATYTTTLTETATNTATSTATVLRALPTNTRRPALATNTPRTDATAVAVAATDAPTLEPPTTVAPTVVPPTATSTALPPTATPVPPSATVTLTQVPTLAPTLEPTVELIAAAPTLAATSTLPRVLGRDTCVEGDKLAKQPTAVPPPAPRMRSGDNDIMNILLLGTDQDVAPDDPSFRTDVLMIVSINRTTNTVAMLSIPRDLYVCIPALGMNRINVAYEWGEAVGWDPGGGFGLLQETILYNLGIPVHYYARVSLTGFKQIVDSVNGVNIAVDCPIIDSLRWLGNYDAENNPIYEPFSLQPGYYHMDGSFALWYARERKSSRATDFDRNRRQQQVLRAIWRAARDQGLIQKAPELWNQLTGIVATNLTLLDAVGLAPLALNLNPGQVTTYVMYKGYQLEHFKTPQGEDVQVPIPEPFFQTITNFYTPPSANRLGVESLKIEVYDGSEHDDWDKLATDVIGWVGIPATAMGKTDPAPRTMVYDYTGGGDQAIISLLKKSYNLKADQVIDQPDPNRTVDYKIVVGADFNACTAPGYGY